MNRFELLLPPTWSRIDLVHEPAESVRRYVNTIVRTAPPTRQPALRAVLAERVEPGLLAFADNGALCVLTPAGLAVAEPVRPMVVIRRLDLAGELDPMLFLQLVAGEDPSARVLEVPDLVVLRTEDRQDTTSLLESLQPVHDAVAADLGDGYTLTAAEIAANPGAAVLSARVRYLMGVPGDPDRWLDVQCAVDYPSTSEGTTLADDAIELVDAFIPTFRWIS